MKRITAAIITLALGWASAAAQDGPLLHIPQILTNREAVLSVEAQSGQLIRIESSLDLKTWTGLSTFLSSSSSQQTDSAAPFVSLRFYHALSGLSSNTLSGDHLGTADGEMTFHPINHATFVMSWNGRFIYVDPVGGAARFQGLPRPDLILVTHTHSDHFETATLSAIKGTNSSLVVPFAAYQLLPSTLRSIATVLTNGAGVDLLGLHIDALPAYNLTSTYHLKGAGNGYLLTIGGKRIYVSGDTEDISEMRSLSGVDVAFVCMNLPYTMSVDKAVSAVRAFQPKMVYVYHYSGYAATDLNRFKQLVGTDLGIEVRLRKWY